MTNNKKKHIKIRCTSALCRLFFVILLLLQQVYLPSYAALSCFSDNFNRSSVGSNWLLKDDGDPVVIDNNRLRLDTHLSLMTGLATYKTLFSSKGIITITFDYAVATHEDSANGMTVVLSDALVTPEFGGNRGSLGYAKIGGRAGFKGGWLGIGIDDWGAFSNGHDGRNGGPGTRKRSIAIRGEASRDYPYITGTGSLSHWALSSDGSNTNQFKITVDSRILGQTNVTVARGISGLGSLVNIIPTFNVQPSNGTPPANYLVSFVAANGGFWSEPTYIDNLMICHDPTPSVHHFELSYSASPLTCRKESVLVKACANSNCSSLVTDTFTATLTSSNTNNANWEDGGQVTLTNGTGSLNLLGHNTSPVTLGVSNSVLQLNSPQCRRGGSAASSGNCTLSFADSGFLINAPDKLAGKSSHTTIHAVRKSSNSLDCVPALANVTKQVKFWSQYHSPSSPVNYNGSQPQITLSGNAIGRSESEATTSSLGFDSQGRAFTTLGYPDAGRVSLHAKYNPPSSASDGWLNLSGSDSFVSVPRGLCVTSPTVCTAANGTCPKLVKAGETFPLTISAKAWVSDTDTNLCDNPTTPNYQQNNIVLSSIVKAPAGGSSGIVGQTSYTHTLGQSVTLSQSISEVGVFTFTANPPENYLGSSASFSDIPQAESLPIGRFIPAEFAISDISHQPACGTGISGFSYMGQPYKLGFKVSARNTEHNLTQNYESSTTSADNFAHSTLTLVAENASDGIDLSGRLSSTPIPNWSDGEAVISNYQISLSRPTAPTLSPPLSSLSTGVMVNDNDDEAIMFSPDMNPSQTGDCVTADNCTAKNLGVQQLLFGRLKMENTFGPENEILTMPLRAEYWNGSWQINHLDNCTEAGSNSYQFNPNLTSAVTDIDAGYIYDPTLVTGQTLVRSGSGRMNLGEFLLRWQSTATGGAALYRGKVTAPLEVPPWLQYYWNWNGSSPNVNDKPRASARFGRFRGNDKSTMWKEL